MKRAPMQLAQQANKGQDKHDVWLLAQSNAQLKAMAGKLGKLLLSKVESEQSSSSAALSENSDEMEPFTEAELAEARALGWM